MQDVTAQDTSGVLRRRERLLRVLAAATFIIFFQAFMVAPIIPALSHAFGTSVEIVGLIVPAYLIPYGIATLAYGLLADRLGIHRVMFASLAAFAVLTALTATAASIEQIALWRVLTGLGASGVVPLGLTLVGRLFPYEQRGRPLGWLFGAMAGGMAFGSPLGAILVPFIGWQGLFLAVGAAGAGLLLVLLPYRGVIAAAAQPVAGSFADLFRGYKSLLGTPRGQRTYGYVLVNSMFHSGVFTWLGVYFASRYDVGPVGVGLALLGYGVPGFLFGPLIGRGGGSLGPCLAAANRSRAQRDCGYIPAPRLPPSVGADRGDGPVARLRHDAAAPRGHRHLARRPAARTSYGFERLHALRWLWAREPYFR